MPAVVRLGGVAGHPQAQVRDDRRGRDGRRGGRDRRPARLPGRRARTSAGSRAWSAIIPETVFRALVDDPDAARALSEGMAGLGRPLPVLVDLDVGMGRTGIAPGDEAEALYELIDRLPNLVADGLSAYDGQIHDFDPAARAANAADGDRADARPPRPAASPRAPRPPARPGGDARPSRSTPRSTSRASNARRAPARSTTSATATRYPDLPFTPAAALLTRVISRPRPGRLCLDLGHKAVAADPAGPRVDLARHCPTPSFGGQSEEHLVVDTRRRRTLPARARHSWPSPPTSARPAPSTGGLTSSRTASRSTSGTWRRGTGSCGSERRDRPSRVLRRTVRSGRL